MIWGGLGFKNTGGPGAPVRFSISVRFAIIQSLLSLLLGFGTGKVPDDRTGSDLQGDFPPHNVL